MVVDWTVIWTALGVLVAGIMAFGAFFLWAVNAILAPLRVSIDKNSELIREVVLDHKELRTEVKEHGEAIADMKPRIFGLEKFQDRCQEAR